MLGFPLGILVVVVTGFRWQASRAVDVLLERPIWNEPGQITGSSTLRPGLQISPSEVVEDLRSAGFARARRSPSEFQFTEGPGSLLIRDGHQETLVTFEGDRIRTVSPDSVYRIEGVELTATFSGQGVRRRPIRLSDVPEHLIEVVVAIEDRRFFEHGGYDPLGIARAFVHNLTGASGTQGGSTLTQQLAKNLFLSAERTWLRKARELFIALALEDRLSKQQILELYLNQVYLGQVDGVGIGGIDQAARVYFDTTSEMLTLSESAMIAGIISAPNRFSPIRHPERARDRRDLVLRRVSELGLIDAKSIEVAQNDPEPIQPPERKQLKRAPWAVDYAVETFEADHGTSSGESSAVKIHTTVDMPLQRAAEQAVEEGMKTIHVQAPHAQVALVAMDSTNGDILAMVGSRNYTESSYNRAAHARRHIGSTVKALTWLFAYDHDTTFRGTTPIPDKPLTIPGDPTAWSPENYDGKFLGEVRATDAFAESRNIPAIHVAQRIGFEQLSSRLNALGLSGSRPYPSVSLGAFSASPLELCAAYTVFPGQGQSVNPRIIRSIRMPSGEEGSNVSVSKGRVTSAGAAFLATQDLYAAIDSGTGKVSRNWIPHDLTIGGKTGTSNKERDAWFVGFVGEVVIAVWVGVDKDGVLNMTGAQAAAPVWARFVARSGLSDSEPASVPESVEKDSICRDSNRVAVADCVDTIDTWHQDEDIQACEIHGASTPKAGRLLDTIRRIFLGTERRTSNRRRRSDD